MWVLLDLANQGLLLESDSCFPNTSVRINKSTTRRWVRVAFRRGFPGGSDGEEPVCHAGCPGLIPRSGRSPGEENGYRLQYSCLENPMDGGAWWAIVQYVKNP